MNSWSFTGYLGQDAETRYTQGGDAVVSFSVAVTSGYGDKQATTWARCQLWGKRGEAVEPYLKKGQLVGVVGELTAREWDDKQGQKRTSIEVRVNDLTLLGKRDDSGNAKQANGDQYRQAREGRATHHQPDPTTSGGGLADLQDDIPFASHGAGRAWAVV